MLNLKIMRNSQFVLLCLASASTLLLSGQSLAAPLPLLQPNDIAFDQKITVDYCGTGGPESITYYPAGDPGGGADGYPGSIFHSGHMTSNQKVTEIKIPSGVKIQNYADITDGLKDQYIGLGTPPTTYGMDRFGGLVYVPAQGAQQRDLLYWSRYEFYHVTDRTDLFPNFGISNLDLSQTSDAKGMWHIGAYGAPEFLGTKTGRYLFQAPLDFAQQYLGGRSIISGKVGGPGADSTNSGPGMVAFAPINTASLPAVGSAVSALTLLSYPSNHPYPLMTKFDRFGGGAWYRSATKEAILFVGVRGSGTQCYGKGYDRPFQAGDTEYCYDPCNASKGYHGYPYDKEILFYSPADIAQVALGNKLPWEIMPYATKNISAETTECLFDIGGMTIDQARKHLFIAIPSTSIAIYKVEGGGSGGGDSVPPSAPAGLKIR